MKIKRFKKFGKKSNDGDEAMTSESVNRTVYLTVATLLIILATAIALTSAASRARRGMPDATSASETTASPEQTAPQTEKPEDTKAAVPDTTEAGKAPDDVPVDDVVPTFILPLEGKLGDTHDPTTQVFSNTMKDWRVHLGVDIQGNVGAPVYAAADGVVTEIWEDPLYGKSVTVGHTGKAVSFYQNLGTELAEGLEVGTKVKAGQLLGAVGDDALVEFAEEPHLHFEVKVDGISVNPLDYFSKSAVSKLQKDTAFEH